MSDEVRKPSRGRTFAAKELLKEVQRSAEQDASDVIYPSDVVRPKKRGDCKDGIRPCPFVSCPFNLYLDVNPETGAIKFNFPHVEVWEMDETCVLDIADRGGITLEEVGHAMGLTRERVRQIETRGLLKVKEQAPTTFGCTRCGAELPAGFETLPDDERICIDCENDE